MTESQNFSKESFIYVIGEGLSRSISFLLLPIYASYLSVEDFAILSSVTISLQLVIIFLGNGFSIYLIRGYYEFEDKRAFLGSVLFWSMVVAIVLATIVHLLGEMIFNLMFKNINYRPYLQYSIAYAVLRVFMNHVLSIYRARREAKKAVGLSLFLFTIILVANLLTIYVFDWGLRGILNAQLAAFLFSALVFGIKVANGIKLDFQLTMFIPGVLMVLPLIPHAFSGWLVGQFGRVYIENNLTLSDFSAFVVFTQLASIIGVVNNGLNQSWAPFVFANYGHADLIGFNAKKLMVLVIFVAHSVALFSRELVSLTGKSVYMSNLGVLPFLIFAYLLQMSYYLRVAVLIYHKRTNLLPVISIVAGAVSIVMNILLLPVAGIYGSALAIVGAFAVMMLLSRFFAGKYLKFTIVDSRFAYYCAIIVLTLVAGEALSSQVNPYFLVSIKGVLLIVSVSLLFKLGLLNYTNLKRIFS